MRTRGVRVATAVCALLLALPLGAEAQPAAKVWRIGWLYPGGEAGPSPIAAFRQGMRDLGYVEGQNLTIEYGWADGKPERYPELVTELLRRGVDAFVASGPASTAAARESHHPATDRGLALLALGR